LARSYQRWGGKVVSAPKLGDIVVLRREGGESWQGHAGFWAGESHDSVWLLGGNQKNMVCYYPFSKADIITIRRKATPIVGIKQRHLKLLH